MLLNGKIFVPPTCPSRWDGEPFDLASADPQYRVHDCVDDGSGNDTSAEAWFAFSNADPGVIDNYLPTTPIVVPITSELSERACRIDPDDIAIVARMGALFCERIANCHGVVDGECWALGEAATREVIEQITS